MRALWCAAVISVCASVPAYSQSAPPAAVTPRGDKEVLEDLSPETLARVAARMREKRAHAQPRPEPSPAAAVPPPAGSFMSARPVEADPHLLPATAEDPLPQSSGYSASGPIPGKSFTINPATAARTPVIPRLSPHDKFMLFVVDSSNLGTAASAAFDAGLSITVRPKAGAGPIGFDRRFGAALGGEVTGNFLSSFLLPVAFREDPRFYRKGEGPFVRRLAWAATRPVIGRTDAGKWRFNFSHVGGAFLNSYITSTYYPYSQRDFGSIASRGAVGLATDAGWDVLREFYPAIARFFHAPGWINRMIVGSTVDLSKRKQPDRPPAETSPDKQDPARR